VGDVPRQPVPRRLDAPAHTVLLALNAAGRRAVRVLALATRLHLIDKIARATTANMVHGSLLGAQTFLLLQFLVEAEHGPLLLAVHVAGAAAAGVNVGGGADGGVGFGDVEWHFGCCCCWWWWWW